MAILKRSCCGCGCDVKTGFIVVAIIWIILSLIGVGYSAYGVQVVASLGVVSRTYVALLIVFIVTFITNILLITAIVQHNSIFHVCRIVYASIFPARCWSRTAPLEFPRADEIKPYKQARAYGAR
ncbi:hypothetical protein Bbelb_411490 [Branchiostoma belcheri]|nr:hypothetical protein Bbelb_411490 [Branchiostoma belcheri]